MKFLSLNVAFLAASCSAVAQGPPPLVPLTTTALQGDIVGSNLQTHAQALQDISMLSNDKRSHGTVGHNLSVTYFKTILDLTGFYDTELHPVTSSELSFTGLAISDSAPTTYTGVTPIFGSPAGLVTATLLVISNAGCASADFPGTTTGKLAVIRRGTCTFAQKVTLAKTAGAVGVIIVNNDPVPSHFFAGIVDPNLDLVQTILIHKTGGDALIANIGTTPGLTGTVNVQFTATTSVGYNLIATSRRGDRDNIVQIGAHLDSVSAGPGINDNGSGSVTLLELAYNLHKYSFTNAVRFSFWTAEEHGLVGSYQYIKGLSDTELSKIALYLNFDRIGSINAGYFVYDPDCSVVEVPAVCPPPGVAHIRDTFLDYFTTYKGVPSQPHDMYGVSDYQNFLDVGIPSGYLASAAGTITPAQALLWGTSAGSPFDPCYHQACDTMTNLNVSAMVINAKGAADALATYANSVAGLNTVTGRLMSPYQRRSLHNPTRRGDGFDGRHYRHRS